jgi:hypothetical protein
MPYNPINQFRSPLAIKMLRQTRRNKTNGNETNTNNSSVSIPNSNNEKNTVVPSNQKFYMKPDGTYSKIPIPEPFIGPIPKPFGPKPNAKYNDSPPVYSMKPNGTFARVPLPKYPTGSLYSKNPNGTFSKIPITQLYPDVKKPTVQKPTGPKPAGGSRKKTRKMKSKSKSKSRKH